MRASSLSSRTHSTQAFAAPLLGYLGSISLIVLYSFLAVGGLVAPYFARRLGSKRALITAAATYAFFVACFAFIVTPIMFVASASMGFGAAVLWVAHGMIMTEVRRNSYVSVARVAVVLCCAHGCCCSCHDHHRGASQSLLSLDVRPRVASVSHCVFVAPVDRDAS
jgi:MFS family permease